MPVYPYLCTACGHEFETSQSIKDDKLTKCPECGADSATGEQGLKRLIGGGGTFIWKGGPPTSKTYV